MREPVQLELDLFPGEPWDGRSPRVLTRGHMGFIFNARAGRARVQVDHTQLHFWPLNEAKRLKRQSRMAPTLLLF